MKYKLLFLKKHEVKNGDGIENDNYEEGHILETESEGTVEHFERRGLARLVDDKEIKAMAEKAAAEKAAAEKAAAEKAAAEKAAAEKDKAKK